MPRILVSSDWHIDARTAGHPRFTDAEQVVQDIDEMICRENVDIFACLGDYYDPGRITDLRYATAMVRWAHRINRRCGKGSIWVTGNHDVVDSSHGITTLSPLEASAEFVPGPPMVVATAPRFDTMANIGFLCLPYPIHSRIEAYRDECSAAITAAKTSGQPVIVLSHLSVEGAAMGSESTEMARGPDVGFPFEEIKELNPVYALNGHYHIPQRIHNHGLKIDIPGSPLRLTFSEKDGDKGFILIEI